jgi:hypothetical protein
MMVTMTTPMMMTLLISLATLLLILSVANGKGAVACVHFHPWGW